MAVKSFLYLDSQRFLKDDFDAQMNILHLEASHGWGGQEIRILREAEGMRTRGARVIFACVPGAILGRNAREMGFCVYEVNFQRTAWLFSLPKLLWILWRHKIELLNTHSSLDAWLGGIAGRLARKKIIRTRHLSTPVKQGWNSRCVYGKLADFIVTTCASIIDPIAAQSGKSKTLFRSIATGVDPKRMQVNREASLQFRQSLGADFLVGTACFMRSWKGIEVLLQAASRTKHVKWVIIGGGHEAKYRQLAADMDLESIVYFTGHLEDPFPALAALDVFTLLSTAHEGVSQAILQAAFLNKPLVATPTGGLSEVCIDGVTGIQVPIFQPQAVADAICKLAADPVLAQRLGEGARNLVLERFTFKQTLDSMEAVYKMVMHEAL